MQKLIPIIFIAILVLLGLLLLFPNLFNHRELEEFGGEKRLMSTYLLDEKSDSVLVYASDFYDRNGLITWLLGEHHRALWKKPVYLPVFIDEWDTIKFDITRMGGGQQTTSFKMIDNYGRNFTLRSVNKDQANAVPGWLRKTGIRTLFRDQASALHPFGAPVVAALADAAEIPHTDPKLVFVPHNQHVPDSFEIEVANRIMLLEVEPNKSWDHQGLVGPESIVVSSKKLIKMYQSGLVKVDHVNYAYCRTFDVLIGDWDRHARQWKWVIDTTSMIAQPYPVDRDMAFYKFNDGVINQLALHVNNKFQSFESDFDDLSGYFRNGRELDTLFLGLCTNEDWENISFRFMNRLTPQKIHQAFQQLPPPVYDMVGEDQAEILQERVKKLPEITGFMSNNYSPNWK